jgi:hypothetical protein
LRSCPETVIWLAMVGGADGPLPTLGATVAGVSTGDAFAGAAGTGFCLVVCGLARLVADTWIGGKTVVEDGCAYVADGGGAAAPGALLATAVCPRVRTENARTAK